MKPINIDLIDTNPKQPRKKFDDIDELAASIKEKGLLEPITLRPAGNRFVIVMGERRFKAAKLAGLTEIEAQIKNITDQEAYELALIENVQRQDLTPIEEAEAFQQLQAQGMTQAAIAKTVGKGQSYVAHKLRLLKLPEFLTYYMGKGILTENHIRQVLKIKEIYPPDLKRHFSKELNADSIDDEEAATFFLVQLRPEGKVILLKAGLVQLEACKLFADYVSKHNGEVDQWLVAAFWWTNAAVLFPLNVAELTTAINSWQERYWDAVSIWQLNYKKNGVPETKDLQEEYWGFWEDLKHSGSLSLNYSDFNTEPAIKWWANVLNRVSTRGSYSLPSRLQASG